MPRWPIFNQQILVFLTRQMQENLTDVVTMGRSFGSFFYFLCQHASSAIPDSRILEQLHTNIRWSLTLRGAPRDAQFLRAALPVTGRMERPEPCPFRERIYFSPDEERNLLLDSIAHLPDRVGYLWLKARSPEAIQIRTAKVEIPEGEVFRQRVEELRQDDSLGGRISQVTYNADIAARDREWFGESEETHAVEERWERTYQQQEALWQE